MYHTDLVLPDDLGNFNRNSLQDFEHYVFVIVGTPEDYELTLKRFGPVLAACDVLCFLIDEKRLSLLANNEVIASLFQVASSRIPKNAVSYIACVSKADLSSSALPQGRWHELFLSLELTTDDKERKLREAIQKALADKPTDLSAYSPFAGVALEAIVRWLSGGFG